MQSSGPRAARLLSGGRNRRRSGDLPLFRRSLCQLSYPTEILVAVPTGFEPATSGLTGRRALQTAPRDQHPSRGWSNLAPPPGGRSNWLRDVGWATRLISGCPTPGPQVGGLVDETMTFTTHPSQAVRRMTISA